MNTSMGEILSWETPFITLKKSLAEVSLHFHLQFHKTILERLLYNEVTLVRKCKKLLSEQVK